MWVLLKSTLDEEESDELPPQPLDDDDDDEDDEEDEEDDFMGVALFDCDPPYRLLDDDDFVITDA